MPGAISSATRRAALAALAALLAAAPAAAPAAQEWTPRPQGRMANGSVEHSAALAAAPEGGDRGQLLAVCTIRFPTRRATLALGTEDLIEGRVPGTVQFDGGTATPTEPWFGPYIQWAYLHDAAALDLMRRMLAASTLRLTLELRGGATLVYVFPVGANRAALAEIVRRCAP